MKQILLLAIAVLSMRSFGAEGVLEEIPYGVPGTFRMGIYVNHISVQNGARTLKPVTALTPDQLACIERQMVLFTASVKDPENKAAIRTFSRFTSLEISFYITDEDMRNSDIQPPSLYVNGPRLGIHFGYTNAKRECRFLSASELAKEYQKLKILADKMHIQFRSLEEAYERMKVIGDLQSEAVRIISEIK